ncbi:unnamed protein product [Acanthoscelides obtectus]|uniref:Uncharacterized protein n=1 Tax=Acanthoscelides obtectus TaxID=200917 RepID=A0A9P0M6N8_ACAOB|nr:unnamed protein product [Acanthoscelides obtectus]CAK1650041.1 hypothetical protein AOBTE_LOCUS16566 [Acanthoscelides obtectus]
MVLFKLARKQEKTIRRKFLNELGLQLAQPHLKRRLNKNLPGELRKDIEDILCVNSEQQKSSTSEPPKKIAKTSRCYLCPRSLDRKSKTRCSKCSQAVCPDHQIKVCENCVKY